MKKMLFLSGMVVWCILSMWLQARYVKPGATFAQWALTAACVVPFYITLFAVCIKNMKRQRRKKENESGRE